MPLYVIRAVFKMPNLLVAGKVFGAHFSNALKSFYLEAHLEMPSKVFGALFVYAPIGFWGSLVKCPDRF